MSDETYYELKNKILLKSFCSLQSENNRSEKPQIFYNYWLYCWYIYFKAIKEICGAEVDGKQYNLFCDFIKNVHLCIPLEDVCIVSRNPKFICWNDNVLHNDNGMSVQYIDGTGIFSINGVKVNEQIVMSPETQTIEEIDSEENAEVKRIRIERYGWIKYLEEK